MAPAPVARITVDVDTYRTRAGISILRLSTLSGIPRTTLRRKLQSPGQFSIDELNAIASVVPLPDSAFRVSA